MYKVGDEHGLAKDVVDVLNKNDNIANKIENLLSVWVAREEKEEVTGDVFEGFGEIVNIYNCLIIKIEEEIQDCKDDIIHRQFFYNSMGELHAKIGGLEWVLKLLKGE